MRGFCGGCGLTSPPELTHCPKCGRLQHDWPMDEVERLRSPLTQIVALDRSADPLNLDVALSEAARIATAALYEERSS